MFVPATSITGIVSDMIGLLILLILIESILNNIIAFGGRISSSHWAVKLLRAIVDPLLSPIRRLLPPSRTQGWDLSPLIAILILQMLRNIL